MEQNEINIKIELHKNFWEKKELKRPLVSFQIGDYFFSKRYKAIAHLLVSGKKITPEMIDVDAFLEDYERMFNETLSIGQDGFWTAEPFTGIPWMEAFVGSEVYGTNYSFITRPWIKSIDDLNRLRFTPDNKWFQKYIEFLKKLILLSQNRFPIGQPILRGISDIIGSAMGQTELVLALVDEPKKMENAFAKVSEIFIQVLKEHYKFVPDFHGGYSFGFYDVWAPGRSAWFQEDLTVLFSPAYYRQYLEKPNIDFCRGYEYAGIHLHPSSFFILDDLMNNKYLHAIEVNKDIGGPSVKKMIPTLQKILLKKNLIFWGDFDKADIDLILENLPSKGLFLNIVSPDNIQAKNLMDYIRKYD